MADNTLLNAGTGGNKVASDELTYGGDTAHVQVMHMVYVAGAEGAKTSSEIFQLEDTGHTSADPGLMGLTVRQDTAAALAGTDADYQPFITDANGRLHVLDANSAAIKTAVELIDNAISGAGFNITQLNGATVPIGAGTEAAAVRVTMATDSTGVMTVDGTVTANLSATDNAVLDTIDAVLDLINAKLVTGTVIGDVNLGATDNTVLDTMVASLAGTLTVTGGGGGTEYTEDAAAAADPVGTALILVREDARAGSLTTTDGDNVALRGNNKGEAYVLDTDANALLTTIDADTGAIKTAVELIDNAIAGTEMQVDVVAALPAGTNAIGKLAANSGVDIGDVDILSIAAGDNNIGNVDVLSVIPGTGATNLGKAIDTAVGATDTGVGMLAKHKEDQVHLTTADDDWDALTMDSLGSLHVNAESHHVIDAMNVTTGWAALGTDTTGLATTKKHVIGTDALEFDKVDGAANTVFGGIAKTISSIDLGDVSPHDVIQTPCYLSSIADVAYVFVRLGTDSTNYNEWRIPDTALTAGDFEILTFSIGDADYDGITGNGWDPSAVTYAAVGAAFDAQNDTLANIAFDQISYHTNQHSNAIIGAEVTTSVSSPNININKVGNTVVDTSSGNLSAGSQRVVVATDDVNLSAIKTAVEILDNAISGSEMQVDIVGALPAGTAAIGKLAANSGVDIGDVDVLSSALPTGASTSAAQLAAGHTVTPIGTNTAGCTSYYDADLDETKIAADTGAVGIYAITAFNTTAAPLFLQLWNIASGSVTVGTTAPTNQFVIPGNADSDGAGFTIGFPIPLYYATALTVACTTDSEGSAAPGAGACIVNIIHTT